MNIKPSDLPLLVSLDMLLEERNVTRAASRLHVSQPALSAQLARLRRLFNDPLLVPSETGRGMVATPKAEDMASALRGALSQLGALGDSVDIFDPADDTATFRVSGSFGAIGTFARPLIQSIHSHRNRGLRLAFHTLTEDLDVLPRFESGDIDLLLVPSEQVPPSLKTRQLMADRFVLVQRRGHPRGNGPVTVEQFSRLEHLVVSPLGHLDRLMDERLKQLDLPREVLFSAPHGEAIGGILAGTDLVCILPESMVDAVGPDVEAHTIPFDLPDVSLSMAWHSRLDKHPAHRWLRDQMIAISRGLRPAPTAGGGFRPTRMREHPRGYN